MRLAHAVGIILIISGTYLQGCATAPDNVFMVEDVNLGNERVRILVTENEKFVVSCKFKKDVKGKRSGWGSTAFNKVIAGLITESVEAGGDVLLIRQKNRGNIISSASGTAYSCSHFDNSLTTSPSK